MVLEKQDSGVCLSATEPSSPTEAAGVARPISFFVDVGAQPGAAAGARRAAAVRKMPTTSSAGVPTTSRDVEAGRTGRQPVPPSASSPNSASRMRPEGVGSKSRKTIGQRLQGALQKLTTKPSKRDTTSSALGPQDQKSLPATRERRATNDRERLERERRQQEWEDSRRTRLSSSTERPAAGPACTRPQLTTSVLEDCETSLDPPPVATPVDIFDGTSDYATASRRTSICTSIASATESGYSTIERRRNKHELRSAEKRRSVEQRLEQQRQEMEEHARQIKLRQEQELERANSLRLLLERQQATRARLANEKVQERREHLMKQKQQSLNDLSARHEAINAKLSAAETKVQKMREEEIQKTKSDLQKRLEQSRQRQMQTEDEMENWRQQLVTYNQWQGDHAEKIARQNQAQKSMSACRTRLEKEKKQQENMKKLMTSEEKRMADVEAAIESKDSRTRALLKEKEEKILRSRERAQATKRLRDDLRAHYSTNDIDQLSRQAMLERRLMTRGPYFCQSSLLSMSSTTSIDDSGRPSEV